MRLNRCHKLLSQHSQQAANQAPSLIMGLALYALRPHSSAPGRRAAAPYNSASAAMNGPDGRGPALILQQQKRVGI